MRVYISGAITGTDDYMERFARAEGMLADAGYSVINPAAVNAMLPQDMTYEEYMAHDMFLMDMCDAVYMLAGWEQSRGANREYGYALAKDYVIWMEE